MAILSVSGHDKNLQHAVMFFFIEQPDVELVIESIHEKKCIPQNNMLLLQIEHHF